MTRLNDGESEQILIFIYIKPFLTASNIFWKISRHYLDAARALLTNFKRRLLLCQGLAPLRDGKKTELKDCEMMSWLKKIFVPGEDFDEEEQPRFWTEHTRIVLAMLFVLGAACVMWWILA